MPVTALCHGGRRRHGDQFPRSRIQSGGVPAGNCRVDIEPSRDALCVIRNAAGKIRSGRMCTHVLGRPSPLLDHIQRGKPAGYVVVVNHVVRRWPIRSRAFEHATQARRNQAVFRRQAGDGSLQRGKYLIGFIYGQRAPARIVFLQRIQRFQRVR